MPVTPRPRTHSALALAAGLLALTACSGPDPAPPPSSAPPVFASEEEALAAVTETYQEFLDISNTILVEGGVGVERIDAIVGAELADFEHESLVELAVAGKTLTGAPILVTTSISDWYPQPDAAGVIALGTACMDLTPVDVLDSAGNSVVAPDRPRTRTWSVQIGPGHADQSDFVLLKHDVLHEGEACAS